MKITYVTMQWPAASETFAARDVNALIAAGNDVSVYALRPDFRNTDYLQKSLRIDDIPSLRMGFKNQIFGFFDLVLNIKTLFFLLNVLFQNEKRLNVRLKSIALLPAVFRCFDKIKKQNPDIVHLFWGHYPSMVGWLVQEKLSHIQVTQFLGPYDLNYNYGLSPVVGKRAGAVFTHTKANVEKLIAKGIDKNKIKVVHRGIETNADLNDEKSKNDLVYVGRLTRVKGIFEMLNVFADVVKINPDAHLTVIGDGADRAEFERKIVELNLKNNITLTGWLSPDEVRAHLNKASIMLFLSHSEVLPNAIKEAMLHSVVPVSSNTTGIDELIDHGVNGLIVKEGDDIADMVCNLINDNEKRDQMADDARQKILNQFDVNVAMKKYRDVWLKR